MTRIQLRRTLTAFLALVVVMACLPPSVVVGLAVPPSPSSSQQNHAGSPRANARGVDGASAAIGGAVLYGVPGSGWTSPTWNWGYAVGTGHDCAKICRSKYASRSSRAQLVRDLLDASDVTPDLEEIKLVLALAWQRGRWDGSDGGPGGYEEILSRMAGAVRYERGDFVECRRRLLEDMRARFATLKPSEDAIKQVISLSTTDEQVDLSLCVCCGHVLHAMGFVDRGL